MLYDNIFIDAVNLAHKTFGDFKNELPRKVNTSDPVYKKSACNFIRSVEDIKKKYLVAGGQIYLLFDNYFSRSDLQTCFQYADRKELSEKYKSTRKKEARPFYNTLNLLRYYYIIGSKYYSTVRVQHLEADDLVRPLLALTYKPDTKTLLVTSDLDWCRYLGSSIDWLPKLGEPPQNIHELEAKEGFIINETSIILYKALFGDESDNIKALLKETISNKMQFSELVKLFDDPYNIISFTRNPDMYSKYPMLSTLNDNERALMINIQLVSTIDCNEDIIQQETLQGSDQKTKFLSVRKALGLDSYSVKTFGGIKASRV